MHTIMVVEDDPYIREALQALLQDEGYVTQVACNGTDALQKLSSMSLAPCVVITDLAMPVTTGWELVIALAADERWASIPRVVMTALSGQMVVAAALVLHKPMSCVTLFSALVKVCPPSHATCLERRALAHDAAAARAAVRATCATSATCARRVDGS